MHRLAIFLLSFLVFYSNADTFQSYPDESPEPGVYAGANGLFEEVFLSGSLRTITTFNLLSKSWNEPINTGLPRRTNAATALSLDQTKLYIYGGLGPGRTAYTNVESFNIITKQFSVIGADGTAPPRAQATAVVTLDNILVLYGGYLDGPTGQTPDSSVIKYNLNTHTQIPVIEHGVIPIPRTGHGAILRRGIMIIFGGATTSAPNYSLNDIQKYDTCTDTWLDTSNIDGTPPVPRGYFGSAVLGGIWYMFGGIREFEDGRPQELVNTVAKYDYHDDIWIEEYDMPFYSCCGAAVSDHIRRRVYYTGFEYNMNSPDPFEGTTTPLLWRYKPDGWHW